MARPFILLSRKRTTTQRPIGHMHRRLSEPCPIDAHVLLVSPILCADAYGIAQGTRAQKDRSHVSDPNTRDREPHASETPTHPPHG